MKLAWVGTLVILTSAYSNKPVFANDIVLQLDIQTGELVPVGGKTQKNEPKKPFEKKRDIQNLRVIEPSPEILEAIEVTAKKYASSKALQTANLSALEWTALFRANIEIESAYNPTIVSKAGAVGLGQLMPDTAADLGVDINDPLQNLQGSAEYLLWLLDSFGSPDLAIAAYNAGAESIVKHKGIPPYDETREHVRKVLGVFFRLRKNYQTEGEYSIVSQQ